MRIVRYISVFTFACALVITLLGLMVIIGWYAHIIALIPVIS